jgi:hypothetical protein
MTEIRVRCVDCEEVETRVVLKKKARSAGVLRQCRRRHIRLNPGGAGRTLLHGVCGFRDGKGVPCPVGKPRDLLYWLGLADARGLRHPRIASKSADAAMDPRKSIPIEAFLQDDHKRPAVASPAEASPSSALGACVFLAQDRVGVWALPSPSGTSGLAMGVGAWQEFL